MSAKIRSGPPHQHPDDGAFPCWAGEIPLRVTAEAAVPVHADDGVGLSVSIGDRWSRRMRR